MVTTKHLLTLLDNKMPCCLPLLTLMNTPVLYQAYLPNERLLSVVLYLVSTTEAGKFYFPNFFK